MGLHPRHDAEHAAARRDTEPLARVAAFGCELGEAVDVERRVGREDRLRRHAAPAQERGRFVAEARDDVRAAERGRFGPVEPLARVAEPQAGHDRRPDARGGAHHQPVVVA